jgi:hypothetical protein
VAYALGPDEKKKKKNMRSKDNAVGIVTKLSSGQKESRGSIPGKSKKFFSSRELQDRVRSLSGLLLNGYDSTAAGVNLATQSTSAEATNDGRYTSTPHTRLCGVHRAPLPMHVGLLGRGHTILTSSELM